MDKEEANRRAKVRGLIAREVRAACLNHIDRRALCVTCRKFVGNLTGRNAVRIDYAKGELLDPMPDCAGVEPGPRPRHGADPDYL